MENLHLKNLKIDFETSLPTNQNYLNSVFKTNSLNWLVSRFKIIKKTENTILKQIINSSVLS